MLPFLLPSPNQAVEQRKAKNKARKKWIMWRLVMEKRFSYTEVCNMTFDELLEANAALDIYIDMLNKQTKK